MNAIEIAGLRKSYRRALRTGVVAVDGLDLEIPSGSVFGLLGPNGSGKTTTIRCLLGLAASDEGVCHLLGAEVPARLPEVVGRVAAIVETPSFFGGFSGRRNLSILARAGGLGKNVVEESLERVGLAKRADAPFRSYSLGMKQRLGLASVLMKDPEVLVLDEPANGLDPAGIKEIRDLIRALGDEGRTVLVSSHILSEVQTMCDGVAILARGRCIAYGPVDEVLAVRGGSAFVVRAPKIREAKKVLSAAGHASTFRGDGSLRVVASGSDPASITKTLAKAGIYLTELRGEEISLESVFLELTGEQE